MATPYLRTQPSIPKAPPRHGWRLLLLDVFLVAGALVFAAFRLGGGSMEEAPESALIQSVQPDVPFQILIPSYMPRELDRSKAEARIDRPGPSGQPMMQLVYRGRGGISLFLNEWIPRDPDTEIPAGSLPIQTRWGTSWVLIQGANLGGIWVDADKQRVAVYSSHLDAVSLQKLIQVVYTLGPSAGRRVHSTIVERPVLTRLPSTPPLEVPVNAEGVQELNLAVTPEGYSPARFSLKKGVPVKLTFRQSGFVGCGNELAFPANPRTPTILSLSSVQDKQLLEFTPNQLGEFEFHCPHFIYHGIVTVRE